MYDETNCFDPNSMPEGGDDGGFSYLPPPVTPPSQLVTGEESLYHHEHNPFQLDPSSMEIHLQQQLLAYSNDINQNQNHIYEQSNPNWVHEIESQHMGFINPFHQQQFQQFQSSTSENPSPDLLNLFHHMPRCPPSSLLPNSSISFSYPISETNTSSYDPLYHLQPPLLRELFQSLPHAGGYNLPGSLFGGSVDNHDQLGQLDPGDGSVLEFDAGVMTTGVGRKRGAVPGKKHFATERDRRDNLNKKYDALKELVPISTKQDRASIVGDAISYIKELQRTVAELKLLVEKKRCGRENAKRYKIEDDPTGDTESSHMKPIGDGALRSSWIQRKCKETEVDVRISDDEVTIKLVQRKMNCLRLVSKVLDDLHLDLHHVAGGHIGDYFSFLFNTKICEGSTVYASAIANKLIEVVGKQFAAGPPINNY